MARRVLVTGSEGFVGTHLCRALEDAGHDVIGCGRTVPPNPKRIACDLTDPAAVAGLFNQIDPPTHLIHLAAMTFLPDADRDEAAVIRANVDGTRNIAEALLRVAPEARLLFVSSCQVYGPPRQLPITEDHPLEPNHPYGESKKQAEELLQRLHTEHGLDLVVARPFNHTGPGHRPEFALPSFARQIARIEAGLQDPVIRVGDLDAKRDLLDVADIVRAYGLLLELGQPGHAYNICRGESQTMRALLDRLVALAKTQVTIETDPTRLRAIDIPDLSGSHEKLTHLTGWKPDRSIEVLLRSLLDHWRNRPEPGPPFVV